MKWQALSALNCTMSKQMKTCFRSWMKSSAANTIFAALDNNARFVGGSVRDALRGQDSKDIDIATPFLPEEVTKRLSNKNIKVVPTGIAHGTITAVIEGVGFEITTLRRDIQNFGRHAIVEFTNNWEEDAARRDFTINAMSCSQEGEVFDYFGGLEDLAAGRLRFVGNAAARCQEDYLRILRFFRFFAYYGTQLDMEAVFACKELANNIASLSGERIQTEMLKLLSAQNPIYSLQLMVQTGVIEHVSPGIMQSNIVLLERVIELENINTTNPLLRLAVLLGKNLDIADYITKRWKLSNVAKNKLLFLSDPNNKIPYSDIQIAKKLIRAWGIENFLDMCIMGYAYGMNNEGLEVLYQLKDWKIPQFPIGGKDLIDLGLSKGKEIGRLLKAAEEWWEENNYNPSKEQLLGFIKDMSQNSSN